MTLPTGTRLGPYDVRSLLGAGGMGEVYLAWDARLNREVAVKVLPLRAASDADRLHRFDLEARAVGALNHPNVVAVYDVGSHEGAPFIVTERLEGETLRARLGSADLTPRKAIEHAVQVARGLAAAHARGIVHRDIKPENVFVCRNGDVKILDFGLARLFGTGTGGPEDETASPVTQPGTIVGTAAYMSPEQVRGLPLDPRSDIFALGVLLYEMLARQRPFGGGTVAEIQTAILREDPRELPAIDPRVSVAVDRVVRRCLEKRPEDRFDTARDVALSLEAVAGGSGELPAAPTASRRGPRLRGAAIVGGSLLAGATLATVLFGLLRPSPPPAYTQLTFRRGTVFNARFAPDGQTVVYSAAWDGQPMRVFTTRIGSLESRDLGVEGSVWAIASNGEMAVKLAGKPLVGEAGKLAQVSLAGGAPRELLDGVVTADWDPNGRDLAVVREVEGWSQLEYPIGHVLYRTSGAVDSLRVLPDGRVAIFERAPDGGSRPYAISLLNRDGSRRVLTSGWSESWPPTWSARSAEVFFSGLTGREFALHAVTLTGEERVVARVPGDFLLYDVDVRGRILVGRNFPRGGVIALAPGEAQERNLSWLDFSYAADLSADGRELLLSESGGGLGEKGGIVLRRTDGAPAVMLGEGNALSLSADGRFVLALPNNSDSGDRLLVVPTGAGERRELRHRSIPHFFHAAWFADGRHIAVLGGEDKERLRVYLWDIDGAAPPLPISPEGAFERVVAAPDGRWMAASGTGMPLTLYPVDGGPPRPLPGGRDDDRPLRWTADGRSLFVQSGDTPPARIKRVEVSTGARHLWKELRPADPAGVFGITGVAITPDGKSYAYTFSSSLGSLYLAEGIR